MADLTPVIETMENRWMRAWMQRDSRELKALTARNFILLVGSTPPVLLDSRSWLEASTTRWSCSSYRFGQVYVRNFGGLVLFATRLEMEAAMDGTDWSGSYWLTDLWRKGRVRRSWRMVQRVVSRVEENPQIPAGIRALQLWRPTPR